jgi:hypothetical protein
MLLLVPSTCDCTALTARLVDTSRPSLVQVELVGAGGLPVLPNGAAARVRALLDPSGVLTNAITPPVLDKPAAPAATLTAVLVRSDGIIARIVRDPAPSPQLQNDLAGLTIQ